MQDKKLTKSKKELKMNSLFYNNSEIIKPFFYYN